MLIDHGAADPHGPELRWGRGLGVHGKGGRVEVAQEWVAPEGAEGANGDENGEEKSKNWV
jgi:hypothetical protein